MHPVQEAPRGRFFCRRCKEDNSRQGNYFRCRRRSLQDGLIVLTDSDISFPAVAMVFQHMGGRGLRWRTTDRFTANDECTCTPS